MNISLEAIISAFTIIGAIATVAGFYYNLRNKVDTLEQKQRLEVKALEVSITALTSKQSQHDDKLDEVLKGVNEIRLVLARKNIDT